MTASGAGHLRGHLGALIAVIVFGASIPLVRLTVTAVPPLTLAVLRFAQGAVILLILRALVFGGRPKVDRRDVPLLVFLGLLFFAVYPATLNYGLRFTESSRVALMLTTGPLFAAILGRALYGDRLLGRQVLGILVATIGVALVLMDRGLRLSLSGSTLAGDGLALVASLSASVYGVLSKPLFRRYGGMTVTTYAMVAGTVLLAPLMVTEDVGGAVGRLHGWVALSVVGLGTIGGAFSFWLYTDALGRLAATQVFIYNNLIPIIASVLGVAWLGETVSVYFAAGFVLALVGIALVNWPRRTGAPAAPRAVAPAGRAV